MPRREAADIAASIGCDVDAGVTKRTTLLVVGDQDVQRLAPATKRAASTERLSSSYKRASQSASFAKPTFVSLREASERPIKDVAQLEEAGEGEREEQWR